jgi:dTDP-4-dehydrorhamnose 3,5-epimerase
MTFTETKIDGVWIVDLERHEDDRGWFSRSWCQEEFAKRGLRSNLSQCSLSFNQRKGTLRGMHYQAPPHEEAKLVRCVRGALYDVALDLRPESPTFRQWTAVELTADNRLSFYIPEGCAHGFLTLAEETEALYLISGFWNAESTRGVQWNDPAFGIQWPELPEVLSARDTSNPDPSTEPAP